jgi:CheY-like chemotaxis protein
VARAAKSVPKQILCVDDHAEGLRVRKLLLETLGFVVLAAFSGEEALGLVEKSNIDAAVLDYHMPGMDGGELAMKLRQVLPDLPIILLTGYPSDVPGKVLREVNLMLTKGSHPGELVSELRRLAGASNPSRSRFTVKELGKRNIEHVLAVKEFLSQRPHNRKH